MFRSYKTVHLYGLRSMCQDVPRDGLTQKVQEKYEMLAAESHNLACELMVLL